MSEISPGIVVLLCIAGILFGMLLAISLNHCENQLQPTSPPKEQTESSLLGHIYKHFYVWAGGTTDGRLTLYAYSNFFYDLNEQFLRVNSDACKSVPCSQRDPGTDYWNDYCFQCNQGINQMVEK